jgi:hypothetical protein
MQIFDYDVADSLLYSCLTPSIDLLTSREIMFSDQQFDLFDDAATYVIRHQFHPQHRRSVQYVAALGSYLILDHETCNAIEVAYGKHVGCDAQAEIEFLIGAQRIEALYVP